ncbi:MAG: family 10 glycosylhydrolase, partial [Lentisphaerota bacterium]
AAEIQGVSNNFNANDWQKNDNTYTATTAGRMTKLTVKLPQNGDFSLKYTVKLLEISGDDAAFNRAHYGWMMQFDNKRKVQVYSWRNRLALLEEQDNKNIFHGTLGGDFSEIVECGPNAKAHTYEILWRENGESEFIVDGKIFGTYKLGKERPKDLVFYFYNCRGEVSSIGWQPLKAADEASISTDYTPTFAGWDSALTVRNPRTNTAINPLASENVEITHGPGFEAVNIMRNARLEYPVPSGLGKSGSLIFWYRPNWAGALDMSSTERLVTILNDKNEELIDITIGHFLAAALHTPFQNLRLNQYIRPHIQSGTWYQIALVWNEKGFNSLYINGSVIQQGQFSGPIFPQKGRVDLHGAAKIVFGLPVPKQDIPNTVDGAIGKLEIFDAPLPAEQIIELYRQIAPVDVMVEQRFIPANTRKEFKIILDRRLPVAENAIAEDAKFKVKVDLVKRSDSSVINLADTSIKLNGRQELVVSTPPLAVGDYALNTAITTKNGELLRSANIYVYEPRVAPPAESADITGGTAFLTIEPDKLKDAELYSNVKPEIKELNGEKYVEAGSRKGDKFAFEVNFPNEAVSNAKPVALDIYYPDNVNRSAGFYMFVESASANHRDRLEGGIQTGGEISPPAGKMQKVTYYFYPGAKSYLFESKTMVTGMPAAISKIVFRQLAGPVSSLKINQPEGYSGRSLGHLDEDQSFEFTLGVDNENHYTPKFPVNLFGRLLNHFSYTGQNLIAYPLLRYNYIYYDVPGQYNSVDIRFAGWTTLLLDMLEARNMGLLGIVNSQNIPEIIAAKAREDELIADGKLQLNFKGRKVSGGLSQAIPNVVHPEIRRLFLKHIEEMLLRYGSHPAFKGVDLWVGMWNFTSLDNGYDDYTVELFARETGVKVPVYQGESRFASRHDYLINKELDKWLEWRARKSTEQVIAIEKLIQKINPKLKFYVNLSSIWQEEYHEAQSWSPDSIVNYYYRKFSIDIAAIKAKTSAIVVPHRNPTRYRWLLHWDGTPAVANEIEYSRDVFTPFLRQGQAPSWNMYTYFETWEPTLCNKKYAVYFENADVKNAGRDFLRPFAFSLAAADSDVILGGGQPLAAAGREDLMREFARAFRALPEQPFTSLQNTFDPVTIRYLKASDGTVYLYMVNLTMGDVKVILNGKSDWSKENLSADSPVPDKSEKAQTFQLKPYQTVSYKVKDLTMDSVKIQVIVSDELINYFSKQISELKAVEAMMPDDMPGKKAFSEDIQKLEAAAKSNCYAEAHRLLGGRLLQLIPKTMKSVNRELFEQEQKLQKQGYYAVNCGSSEYLTAGGKIFSPGRRFNGTGYGHVGRGLKITRDITRIKPVAGVIPELFANELYDFDSYKFAVPNGSYTVKLYAKVGHEPANKPGVFVFKLSAQGKVLNESIDLNKATNGDFGRTACFEFNHIKVSDGMLVLDFFCEGDQTAKLCNAIEVIPEK